MLMHILNYIQAKNFREKLFIISKSIQNRINLNYSVCKQKYLEEIGFYINQYSYKEKFDPFLIDKYNNFLYENKIDKKLLEKIIVDINNDEVKKKIEEDFETKITFYSPLFDSISKTKNFSYNYTKTYMTYF